jgi:hypothetical protein
MENNMSALANLKLVAAKRPTQLSPIAQRRNKVVKRIAEQIALAEAVAAGRTYAPMRVRNVTDKATGETKSVETAKRVKAWWWNADNGKLVLSLRYGAKVIDLAKGKSAIELGSTDELVSTLSVLRDAVINGELDAQIEIACATTKAGFKK